HFAHSLLPISTSYGSEGKQPKAPFTGRGWILRLLPYLEQEALYRQFEPSQVGNFGSGAGLKDPACRDAMEGQLAVLQCPSDRSVAKLPTNQLQWEGIEVAQTSYKGVIGDTKVGGNNSIHEGTMPDCHNTTGCNGLFYRNDYQEPIRFSQIT